MTSDPAALLAATPATLAHLVAEATNAQLDAAATGEWSARTILAHMRDDEYLCMRVALERMLAEDTPTVHFMDGGDWEPGRNRARDRKEWLLGDFALQRQATLGIIRGMRVEEYERTGRTCDRDPFTIAAFLGGWARHDSEHIGQLERALGETLAEAQARRARPE